MGIDPWEFVLYRGDSKTKNILVKKDGEPVDITNWTFRFTVKKDPRDPIESALINKIVSTHIDPEHGLTAIELTSDDTRSLPTLKRGTFVYDIRAYVGTSVVTILNSTVRVLSDVSPPEASD